MLPSTSTSARGRGHGAASPHTLRVATAQHVLQCSQHPHGSPAGSPQLCSTSAPCLDRRASDTSTAPQAHGEREMPSMPRRRGAPLVLAGTALARPKRVQEATGPFTRGWGQAHDRRPHWERPAFGKTGRGTAGEQTRMFYNSPRTMGPVGSLPAASLSSRPFPTV